MLVLKGIVLLLAGAALVFAFWVRLAPLDVARWHVDPFTAPDPGVAGFRAQMQSAGPPQEVLARLDRLIRKTPRTRLIAGSVQEGRLSYETRSWFWRFPDYTTISAQPGDPDGTRLAILGRLRFGRGDLGVNRVRIKGWIKALGGAEHQ